MGDLYKHTRPRKVDGDVLYVATSSSVWAQELSYMSRKIINKINAKLGGNLIKEIRFSTHLWKNPTHEREQAIGRGVRIQTFVRKKDRRSLNQLAADFQKAMQLRKEYLLQANNVLCRSCGYLYPARLGDCPYCRIKEQSRAYVTVMAILERKPGTPDLSIIQQVGISHRDIIRRVRQELDERWLRVARNLLKSGKSKMPEAMEILKKLACLRCCKELEDIPHNQLAEVLGKRLYGYLKMGGKR